MSDQPTTRFAWLLVFATVLFPFATQAQDDRWYQVELVVFSQPSGGNAEQWDAIPKLEYPEKSHFLTDKVTSPAPTAQGTPASASQATPYVTLPSSQQELRGRVASMQRSGRYRILFHDAWTQPIVGKSASVPIILDHSGDGGAWPALQGSVNIYVARYLYVETNLWLNTQGDYLKGSWKMPAPPLAPSSMNMEEVFLTGLDTPATEQPSQQQALAESAPTDESGISTGIEAQESAYPFRHAVLLKQTRRMRSSEIHYIDHPLLGVIVKITPLAAAEPQDSAPEA